MRILPIFLAFFFFACGDVSSTTDENPVVPPPPPPAVVTPVYLFHAGLFTGDLGGPDGALEKCELARSGSMGGLSVAPFLSTQDVSIADMPLIYGFSSVAAVYGADELLFSAPEHLIASSWSDLLDGEIENTLKNANVFDDAANPFFWSGSTPTGQKTDNCFDFTKDDNIALEAQVGYYDLLSSGGYFGNWLSHATFLDNFYPCEEKANLLCIAF